MKVCLMTSVSVGNAWQNSLGEMAGSDVVAFGFNGLKLVSYKKELGGDTEYFSDVARLSRGLDCVVISGCDTDSYGIYRHSAVVSDRGRILGVNDAVYSVDGSEFSSGGGFKVYETHAGRIGVIVGKDLFFPESARVLSLCDADIIVCPFKKVENQMPAVMLRAGAFSCGVPSVLCAENYSAAADTEGNILSAGGRKINKLEIKTEKDYRYVTSRRRGLGADRGVY